MSIVTCQVSGVTCQVSYATYNSQTLRARELTFLENVHPHQVMHVTCHMSNVMCHVSCVMCQVSTIFSSSSNNIYIFNFYKVVVLVGEGLLLMGPTPSSNYRPVIAGAVLQTPT